MSVAVSIVSFNTRDLLENCLKNLMAQKTKNLNVWVLDNNSQDGSASMVEKEFPRVHLIKSDKNLGFAKGQNQILKKINDKYVLVLNPDTQFDENIIEKMVSFMERNRDCAIASCKITDFGGKLESNGGDFPFGLALLSWVFNLEFFGKLPNFHRTDPGYFSRAHEVDWVGGTFMMMRTDILQKAGFFNEDFFMYFEDVEICYRIKSSGLKVMINPDVSLKHKSGSSSKNPRLSQWKGEFEGLIKFYNKRGFLDGLYVRILIYLAVLMRILAFSLTGKFGKSLTYTKVLINI